MDDKCILILGDIGVHGFRHLFKEYPDRVFNIGICEQATIGFAAGLAKEGFHPIFYTIAPFAVERCFEQIKIDIGYQNLPVTIVSIGSSYDYAALGYTHHCPADVELIKTIPNVLLYPPCTTEALSANFFYWHGKVPLYIRLHESAVEYELPVKVSCNLIIAFGEMEKKAIDASVGLDVSINTRGNWQYDKILILEPWLEGVMERRFRAIFPGAKIKSVGLPRTFNTDYGKREEHDKKFGFDTETLRKTIIKFIDG